MSTREILRGETRKFVRKDFCSPQKVLGSSISCTTFNILSPSYKRIGNEHCRESHYYDAWLNRNQRILDMILPVRSSVICLQEFWIQNDEFVQLYENALSFLDYATYKLARTNGRGDGLLTAIKKDCLKVLDYRELCFHDCGDRVAQIFHLRLKPGAYNQSHSSQDVLLVNTHLLFPHDYTFCRVRLQQAHKIIDYLDQYEEKNGLSSASSILCGDWNGSKRGEVYNFLRSQGFVSSYDSFHNYTDGDTSKWISHRNHRGNLCAVDFIWLRNPSGAHGIPSKSRNETPSNTPKVFEQTEEVKSINGISIQDRSSTKYSGLHINNAYLFPPEVEQGLWPKDYSLSDHAQLTVVFQPILYHNQPYTVHS